MHTYLLHIAHIHTQKVYSTKVGKLYECIVGFQQLYLIILVVYNTLYSMLLYSIKSMLFRMRMLFNKHRHWHNIQQHQPAVAVASASDHCKSSLHSVRAFKTYIRIYVCMHHSMYVDYIYLVPTHTNVHSTLYWYRYIYLYALFYTNKLCVEL